MGLYRGNIGILSPNNGESNGKENGKRGFGFMVAVEESKSVATMANCITLQYVHHYPSGQFSKRQGLAFQFLYKEYCGTYCGPLVMEAPILRYLNQPG